MEQFIILLVWRKWH